MPKPNPMGATFAERTAAASGKASFDDPTPDPADEQENSSFADRGGKPKKAAAKQVDGDGEQVEDKAVQSASTKKRPAKKS